MAHCGTTKRHQLLHHCWLLLAQEVVRMAALQWALKLFPFSDITARYVCILAAADTRCVGVV